MRALLFCFILMLSCRSIFAQADSVLVVPERPDGIYLTYADFRRNLFVSKEQITSELPKDQLDFLSRIMAAEKFSYASNSGSQGVEIKNVWGFYQNKTLYINFRNEFFRVPVFGSLCYLVATVTVMNNGFYDPMFGYGVNASRTKEIREFIINFYDGVVTDFTIERAEQLISRDATLFAEYMNLSRRSRKEQLNRYIRRYNDAHPVYFLR